MNSEQKKNTEYPYEFSIIMAVYNVEPYLKEAVDSVLKQTFDFKKVQIILVDDGSPDKSGEICDAYAKKYPENIFVIHKENGGVSSARNAGLAIAKGRYINFMDPDDKISPDTLSSVYAFFDKFGEQTDVVTIKTIYFGGRKGAYHLNWRFSKEDKVADLNGQENYYIQKAVNAVFFQNSALIDIKFDENLAISEDVKFVTQVLTKRMKLGFCAKGPNADLGCTKREGQFCAFSIIFLRAGAVRRGFAGANLLVGPCALGLRTGGGRRPDYTSSTSSWDHCGARPMCSPRVL